MKGGPTGAILARKNPNIRVSVVDVSASKIAAWNSRALPVFEPGLDAIVEEVRGQNLFFSTVVDDNIKRADLIFISVGTPTKSSGPGKGEALDMIDVEIAMQEIANIYNTASKDRDNKSLHKIVVQRSTVPCGTAEKMQEILNRKAYSVTFEVLSNPEFLAQGSAVFNLTHPDRVLIGCRDTATGYAAANSLASIYASWVPMAKIITMRIQSAELAKVAANALLAQRISSINALSAICEATGADVREVGYACGLDTRLGNQFLNAGVGFGGSCFEKDILGLSHLSDSLRLTEIGDYWRSVIEINKNQVSRFANCITRCLKDLRAKHIAVLGLSFKPCTSDTRGSPALAIVTHLLQEGATVSIYDPKVLSDNFVTELIKFLNNSSSTLASHHKPQFVKSCIIAEDSVYRATKGAHAIVVLTDWEAFGTTTLGCDWERIYREMVKPAWAFDGRCFLNINMLKSIGFLVESVGIPSC